MIHVEKHPKRKEKKKKEKKKGAKDSTEAKITLTDPFDLCFAATIERCASYLPEPLDCVGYPTEQPCLESPFPPITTTPQPGGYLVLCVHFPSPPPPTHPSIHPPVWLNSSLPYGHLMMMMMILMMIMIMQIMDSVGYLTVRPFQNNLVCR